MVSPPAPSGARHDVGVEELFFSTTDARGVIEQANSVFVRLSRHPREALVGAPHNIIRHPVMPGGAFLLMWSTLQAGEPFCAYVDNLAADGSTYGVFATITPLGEGYLSVRGRPFQTALRDAAFDLYRRVRPEELGAREAGGSAHDAAVLGLDRLAGLLAEAGFASYEEFAWVALPAEVEARLAQAAGIPERPGAQGPLAGMLAATRTIEAELHGWAGRLGDLQAVADRLLAAAPRLRATVQANREDADRIREEDTGWQFASAVVYLRLWAGMAPEVSVLVTELVAELEQLRRSCARTRFRIALAVLHNLALGQFVTELIDQVPGFDEARPAVAGLRRALDEGIAETREQTARNAAFAAAAADRIAALRELLDLPQAMIRQWLATADHGSASFARTAETVQAGLDRTAAGMELLDALSVECRRIATPLEAAVVEAQLDRLRAYSTPG